MRKSVSAFVFGLIGGLFCVMWGFIFGVLGEGLSGCDLGSNTEAAEMVTLSMILGYFAFIGGIVCIIGASQCFRNARRGGIILASALVPASALLVYWFVKVVSASSGNMVFTFILLLLLPVIFLIVSTVCAFLAKDQPELKYNPYGTGPIQSPAHPAAPVQQSNSKTLEQELTELKNMRDKNLLTEEEYNQARQKAISNYNK